MPETEETTPPEESDVVKNLRTDFETQKAVLQRENLLLRAVPGLDTTTEPVQAFLERYQGEMTAEAIAAKAKDWGIAAPAPASTTTETTTTTPGSTETPPPANTTGTETPPAEGDEARQAAERTALANGTQAPVSPDAQAHPANVGLANFHKQLAEGSTREDAAAAGIDPIIAAAANGDERVLWTPNKHREKVKAMGIED